MIDANEQKQDVPPSPRRQIMPVSRTLVVTGLALLAGAAVLYGILAPGKEAIPPECAPAAAVAARIEPAARGEVAALAPDTLPRPVPGLAFEGPGGNHLNLADFHGRTVLLNLWATWCIPCREEMPSLDRLQARLGGADFEVVAVNIDTARLDRRQAFLRDIGVKSLAFYADPSADVFQILKKAGKVTGLPTTILIDPHGCELGIMPGPANWSSDDATHLVSTALGRS